MLAITRKNKLTSTKFITLIAVFMIGFFGSFATLSILSQNESTGNVAGVSDERVDSSDQSSSADNTNEKPDEIGSGTTNTGSEPQNDNTTRTVTTASIDQSSPSIAPEVQSQQPSTAHTAAPAPTPAPTNTSDEESDKTSSLTTTQPEEESSERPRNSLLTPIVDTLTKPLCIKLCE